MDFHQDEICSNGTNGTVDVAFRKISRSSAAFQIWRIENMNIVAVPRDQYGTFYETDSYIVYAAAPYGQPCDINLVSREVKGGVIEHHIHFWLGSQTTPEKSGVAAYKAVELDNFLNGCCIQHRETEGDESSRFLSYFKSGIRIVKPELIQNGNASHTKLYRIRGKRTPITKEMPSISWNYFTSSSIYLIVTPKSIFVWIGRATTSTEKLKATEISLDMKEGCGISNIIFVDDGYEKTMPEDRKQELNTYLPLEKRMILPDKESGDENGNFHEHVLKLYKCSESNGKYRVVEIKNGPLQQSDLNSDDVFIIDQELKGVWAWVGRRSSDKERSEALRNARGFVKKKKYPNQTRVTRVVEGHESSEFKALFTSWRDDIKAGCKPAVLLSRFDAIQMEERPTLAAETQLIDDGSGSVKIWRIKDQNLVEIPKDRHGYFFSGDCYIVLYSYKTNSEENHLLYCWLGINASQEEITRATHNITKIDDEFGPLGFQARIIQGKETQHFLQLFKGKLITFKGRGIDYDESGRNSKVPSHYLVQVFGSTTYSGKAVQVSVKASMFDSNYCFVLKRSKKAYIWCGHYSTGDQREMAKGFAGKDFDIVLEGKEKDDFFSLLGGKTPYSTQMIKNETDPKPPRLFHCTSNNGGFLTEEIMFFTQKDLTPEDIMLLDTQHALYIWIGILSNKEDQRLSIKTALEYLQTDPSGRDMNTTIIHVKQGKEPPTFSGFFPHWNKNFWKSYKTFSKIRHEIETNNTNSNGSDTNGISVQHISDSNFDQFEKYPINVLKEPNDKLPSRVNPLNKEVHLTHDDFVYLFKMAYSDFEKLPRWKQQEMKKKVGLF